MAKTVFAVLLPLAILCCIGIPHLESPSQPYGLPRLPAVAFKSL